MEDFTPSGVESSESKGQTSFPGAKFTCDAEAGFSSIVLRHEFATSSGPVGWAVLVINARGGVDPD